MKIRNTSLKYVTMFEKAGPKVNKSVYIGSRTYRFC